MKLLSYAKTKETEFFEVEVNPLWTIHVKRISNGTTYMVSEWDKNCFRKDRFKKVDKFYTQMIRNELLSNREMRLRSMFMPNNTQLIANFNDKYAQTIGQEEPYADLETKHLFFDR